VALFVLQAIRGWNASGWLLVAVAVAVGAAAAELVEPGDALYLNGGTTTLQVFRHLRATGLKVATNHVGIALEAADRDIELLLLGGHYRAPSNSVVGPFATEALRRTHATKAFIGVEGISVGSGLTTPVAAEAERTCGHSSSCSAPSAASGCALPSWT